MWAFQRGEPSPKKLMNNPNEASGHLPKFQAYTTRMPQFGHQTSKHHEPKEKHKVTWPHECMVIMMSRGALAMPLTGSMCRKAAYTLYHECGCSIHAPSSLTLALVGVPVLPSSASPLEGMIGGIAIYIKPYFSIRLKSFGGLLPAART